MKYNTSNTLVKAESALKRKFTALKIFIVKQKDLKVNNANCHWNIIKK